MSKSADEASNSYSHFKNISGPPVPKRRPGIKRTTKKSDDSFAYDDFAKVCLKMNLSRSPEQYTYRRRDINRSNASNDQNINWTSGEEDDDEEEEEYEEDVEKEEEEEDNSGSEESSYSRSPYSQQSRVSDRSPLYIPKTYSPLHPSFSQRKQSKPPKDSSTLRCGAIGLILCIAIFYFVTNQKIAVSNKKNYDLDQLIKNIRETFHNQEFHIWNDISSQIDDVMTYGNKPSIIVLFANEESTINCLAQTLGRMTSKALGSNNYLYLTPRDFGVNLDQIIYKLQEEIPPKKVVVVKDLLKISPTAIQVFHFLCDRENPLVKEAVYIITIIAKDYQPQQKKVEFIEELIKRAYSKVIDSDILLPLVTRITDGTIVSVKPELFVNTCPLT